VELAEEVGAGVPRAPVLHGSTRGASVMVQQELGRPERYRQRGIAWRGYSPAAASGWNSGEARVGGLIAGLEKLPGIEAEPLRGLAGTGVQRCSETMAEQGSTRRSKAGVALGFGASATG
jgi:hypothetical protein